MATELKKNQRLEEVRYHIVAANGSSSYTYDEEETKWWVNFYHERGYEAYVFKKEEKE